MPGGVLMCGVCLAFFAFILGLLALEADTRQALVVTPLWFVLLAVAYQWVRRRVRPGVFPISSPASESADALPANR